MQSEDSSDDDEAGFIAPEQIAEQRMLEEYLSSGKDGGGPRGVPEAPNGPLIDNAYDRNEYKTRLWMFSPYDQMIMHCDDPQHSTGYSEVFARDYRLMQGFRVDRKSNVKKLLEAYKLEPISIAKPDDWVEFDEYERIQLPTCQTPCEECGYEETEFKTRQLRSADEGQTVFFFCRECGHKWRTNT